MPFGGSLQVDMEVWHQVETEIGYGIGMCWYGFADTTSNRKPEPEEVLNVPPLPDMTQRPSVAPVKKKNKPATDGSGAGVFDNAVECEAMQIVAKSDGVEAAPQDLKKGKGKWSGSSHLLVRDSKVGDFVELRFPAQGAVVGKLVLHVTKSDNFGILRVSVNGQPAGVEIDLYAARPVPFGPIDLGLVAPIDGAYVLRAEVVGKNPKSKGTFFGIDGLTVNESK